MKDSQKSQKALALVAFLIFLAGLSCYWLKHDDETSAARFSSSPGRHTLKQKACSIERGKAYSLRNDPSQKAPAFEYPTFDQPDRYSTQEVVEKTTPDETPYGFPSSNNANPSGQEINNAINALEISGTSQTSAELVQQVTTRSESKAELFTRVRSLGLQHPDSRIREQALTYLVELGNDLAINSVIEALIDPEPRIRQVALEALYRLGNRVPVQPLIELAARSGNAALQAQVVAFIEQFVDRASISQLTEGLQK